MTIKVEIPNLRKALDALAQSPGIIGTRLNNAIKKSIYEIEKEAKPRTPVVTGRLRSSYQTEFRPLYGSLSPMVNYAIYVHEGTKPHIISVKRAKVLTDGKIFFGKVVHHPGTKAQPFLREGIEASMDSIRNYFEQEINAGLEEIAGKGS